MSVKRDASEVIKDANDRSVDDVVGKQVLCPACRDFVFKKWSDGWDAHAAYRCKGVAGATPEERKATFKNLYQHLFRR